jgi:hypothetical protein
MFAPLKNSVTYVRSRKVEQAENSDCHEYGQACLISDDENNV